MKVLVLSGGGARGAYQLGCLESLIEQGHRWDAIVGTSVGALNAAGLSMLGMASIKKIWMGIKEPSDIISKNWLFQLPWKPAIYSTKPLRILLEEELSKSTQQTIPFYVAVCNLKTLEVSYRISSDIPAIIQDVLASATMPVLMNPVGDFVDGGLRDIVPMSFPIHELNASEITVISCQPYSKNQMAEQQNWSPKFPKILSYLSRTIDALTAEIQWQDMQLCQLLNETPGRRSIKCSVYAPDHLPILEVLDFHGELIKKAYDLGKEMADKGPVIRFGG